MIYFTRSKDEKGLFVQVATTLPGMPKECTLNFYRACASDIECALLEAHLDKQLWSTMEEIRKVYYNLGWKEAKSKKTRKRTDFPEHPAVLKWEKEW